MKHPEILTMYRSWSLDNKGVIWWLLFLVSDYFGKNYHNEFIYWSSKYIYHHIYQTQLSMSYITAYISPILYFCMSFRMSFLSTTCSSTPSSLPSFPQFVFFSISHFLSWPNLFSNQSMSDHAQVFIAILNHYSWW